MKILWAIPFVGLVFAPVAHADIYADLQFVREVNNLNLPSSSREAVINVGHTVCQALNDGMAYDDVVANMKALSTKTANNVASLAVEHICPDQWFQVVTAQIAFPQEARILV